MRRGFSLIEVMVASVMFLLALSGVITAFHGATSLFSHFEKETTATHVAESLMESLILRSRSDPELVGGSTYTHNFDALATQTASGAFTGSWTVLDNQPVGGLKTIILTVSWSESGLTRRVSLTTVRE